MHGQMWAYAKAASHSASAILIAAEPAMGKLNKKSREGIRHDEEPKN
jgi:hypothetical protein